ncbi:MAG: gluconate 2-dehydrogenase subunit 3 family protein [Gammaproteobacteria bacterium]|nr:gluconate 2-dehydrogenase subunit 3 family protein [Gammaproteobacteria bacterium]MCW8987286.1 gluconate 2-dehydrogenase subunit 3 family protein [Gammaproteobacteria bacterium]
MADKYGFSRRNFLRILATAAAAYPLSSLAEKRQLNNNKLTSGNTLKEPWLTLSLVQEHLFPAEKDAPGARDIQALAYLQAMIATPDFDKEDALLIHNGVGWLNDLAQQQYAKKFSQLDTETKEKVLRRIESSRAGSRWLSMLLTYILEALLTDPVYGGNPNGIGWTWLQHQAGFPTPTEDKKYYKLRKNIYRVTKA